MTTITTPILLICLFIVSCTCKNIFVIDSYPESTEDDLVSVVVLYRHGDRAPIGSFPTDPYYNISYWPQGFGQLLPQGMLRQYHLGQWLRNRYDNFLPAEYSNKDIVVYSTDVDRTLMSAQANLAGLYPPTPTHIWEEDFLWEPIPVHRMSTVDPVLTMNVACKKFDRLIKELESSDFFANIPKNNKVLFEKLTTYTGKTVSTVGDVSSIYDVIYDYRNHNESYIPSWVDDVDMEQVKYLSGVEFSRGTFTEDLKRLRPGPFINYLINRFQDVVNNVTGIEKFLMLSAHDSTVSSVLGGLDLFDYNPPEFTATVIFELRKNAKDQHYVNVIYKRNSTDAFEELSVGECNFNCLFDDFKTNLASVNIDSDTWQAECEDSHSGAIRIFISWAIVISLVALNVLA